MASIGTGNSSGRRRSLDAEINLVPFIDLLSMCICFLLMTAIWVEVGSIQVKQILGTEAATENQNAIDIQVQNQSNHSFSIRLERAGKVLQNLVIDGDNKIKLQRFSQYVGQLTQATGFGSNGVQITARVIPSFLNYAELIEILDVLRGYGITNLAVVPTRE